jgi:hypothetical protein
MAIILLIPAVPPFLFVIISLFLIKEKRFPGKNDKKGTFHVKHKLAERPVIKKQKRSCKSLFFFLNGRQDLGGSAFFPSREIASQKFQSLGNKTTQTKG